MSKNKNKGGKSPSAKAARNLEALKKAKANAEAAEKEKQVAETAAEETKVEDPKPVRLCGRGGIFTEREW